MQTFQRSFRLILAVVVVVSVGEAMAQQLQSPGKPFSNYRSAPTVSPYMNLFRVDGTDFDYQTLVLPMLNQQEFNQRQQRTNLRQYQTNVQQQQTNQTQRRDIRRAGQQVTMPIPQTPLRPTGLGLTGRVGSRFMNTYNYFPPTRIPRQR